MKQYKNIIKGFGALVGIMLSQSAMAQIGAPFIHDQSDFVLFVVLIHDRCIVLDQILHV